MLSLKNAFKVVI